MIKISIESNCRGFASRKTYTSLGGLQGVFMRTFMLSVAGSLKKISPRFGVPVAFLMALFFNPEEVVLSYDHFYFPIGTLVVLIGIYLRVWVRGFVREEGFVVDGPYRYVRNPVELGTVLVYLGVAVALGLSWWQQLLIILLTMAYFEALSLTNEEEIRHILGERYDRYRRRVKRWIPSRYPGMNRSNVAFSVMRGFLLERDFLYFLGILVLLLIAKKKLGLV